VFFSLQKASEKNAQNFLNALGNVAILSVARDSELGWFSLSFDDDDDDLIVEDEDDDG
jgi:hypothetical protein